MKLAHAENDLVAMTFKRTRISRRLVLLMTALLAVSGATGRLAAESAPEDFERLAAEYSKHTRLLLQKFCVKCHSTEDQEGDLDLERFATLVDVRGETKVWLKVAEMLDNGEMPPKKSSQLSPEQRKELRGWVERYLRAEAFASAGDPGPVVLRRLNNAEYTYTIRDLTGVELNPAREFPTDSAAGEGFTNTGNALVMSPGLLQKYLDAGKAIARHAVLLPDGFRFSPQRTRRDWTDELLTKIREFYGEFIGSEKLGVGTKVGNTNVHGNTRIGLAGRLPLEKCFAATLRERAAIKSGAKTIEVVAREYGVNAKYLKTLWSTLTSGLSPDAPGRTSLFLDGLRARWRDAKPDGAAALTEDVAAWQRGFWTFGPIGLIGRGGSPTRWMEPVNPLVTHEELRHGLAKKDFKLTLMVTDAGDGNDNDFVVFQRPRLVAKDKPDILLKRIDGSGLKKERFGQHPNGTAIDPDSICVRAPASIRIRIPADQADGREFVTTAALEKETGREGSVQVLLLVDGVHPKPSTKSGLFTCEVTTKYSQVTKLFSDTRDTLFRGPLLVSEESTARKRIESAIDDYRRLFPAALCFTQIVPVDEVLTLTLFFREDDHLVRLMLDDEQKAQLDRLWEELHYVSESAVQRAEALILLLEVMLDSDQYEPIEKLIEPTNKRAAVFRKELVLSEPTHVEALIEFAARAYRRPLTDQESGELRTLYHRLRGQELSHEESFRLTLARIFVAAPFLYRLEEAAVGTAPAPVSDWELASRLSYFLWSSAADEELLAAAAAGTLRDPEVLLQQTRRMLEDPRVRRLATEFGCQWLHIQDFDGFDEKSEKHFPEFVGLRGDMYEESILFLTDLFQRGESLLSLLDADYTFVNEPLAKFYGIDDVDGPAWRRVDGMRGHGRGGILGLATTLAKQSSASRTSPILRGNWISEVLLGERLPRPPKEVPELPADETATDGLTVRELVTKHTTDPLCSGCHRRIDPFGFALESFDSIGRRRDTDLAGRPVDTKTELPGGGEIDGLPGLRSYLRDTRRDAFLHQFCRKLLGYALAREVQLSDQPLLTEIEQQLEKNSYRFSFVMETIVLSKQFRMIRPADRRRASF